MDRTNEFSKKDIEENKGISCFAYFGFLFVMPLFGASDSEFAQFHANQGMVLAINQLIMIALIFVSHLLSPLYPAIFPVVRMLLWLAMSFLTIFFCAYGVINTFRGKAKQLPLIGSISILR
ncbi:MAG: hypothetical protein IKB86_06790 [Clostridia bacterium]|nr:hypothetical protein [Clostridia bacterium]